MKPMTWLDDWVTLARNSLESSFVAMRIIRLKGTEKSDGDSDSDEV